MSNEFLSRNRMSTKVGQEFASNISVAELAIRSTAYHPTSSNTIPDTPKAKRRVTFNLDDIQIQTIPAYDSASSSSSEVSLDIKPERISKKESYDALLKRKQFRRDHPTTKPGYWYPLASPRTPILMNQPITRSLELTELLINESIQREMNLNPNLHYTPPSPSPSPDTKPHNDTVLITDTDDEEPITASFEETNEFDQITISESTNVLIISPPSSLHDKPIWIDHPSLLLKSFQKQERKGLFFIKVLKAESLDFPIENDHTGAFCSIQYKGISSKSTRQILSHTMQIEHEMRIENVDSNEQIAITIQVDKKEKSWYNRLRSPCDLERYMHEKDGSICQTIFLPSRFVVDGSLDQKATLMLVNNWYRYDVRSSLIKRKKQTREKAVGKIYIQCLYVTASTSCDYLPKTMNEAVEALNAKRFHQTEWQSGYLSQIDSRGLKRLYFTLMGGHLLAHVSKDDIVLYKIPLSRATKLTFNSCLFQLDFEAEDPIQFSCESLQEFDKWIAVLQVMICKLPKLPEWVTS